MAELAGWDKRFKPMVTVVPYVLLAVMVAVTVAFTRHQPRYLAVDLALCAAAAVWSLVLFTARPAWRERRGVMGVFLAGLNVFGFVMVRAGPVVRLLLDRRCTSTRSGSSAGPDELWFVAAPRSWPAPPRPPGSD